MFKKKPTPIRRTPPPSQTNTVFSYHSSRSASDAQRARYESPVTHGGGFKRLSHVPTAIAVVVILGSLGYASVLDNNPRLMVSASQTGKSLQRPDSTYIEFISSELSKSALNKSKFTFNGEKLVTSLQKQYPEVANAVISLPLLGHKPVVKVAVSSPAFILASQNGAYYVSDKGVPLVRVSEVKHQIQAINTVSDESNLPITVGTQILPSETVIFISDVLRQLAATNTATETVTIPQAANELQIRLQGKPYVVRFNTTADARTQVGTLLAVVKRLEGSKESPKEYIDVRVEERAYYK